ncbi:MAG: phage major capsid protein [Selenomonadaceae bacterium]|nr:phage major capsid protein [Selenomonadaceae bacterium]
MELQEMYDELAKLVEEMRQYLDEHEDEDESLSVEEAETYDKMEKRARELQNKIAREEAWAACKPILNNPGEGVQNFLPTRSARGIVGGEYHKNFLNAFRTNFRHAHNELREGALASGGYLLPTEMHDEIISALSEENIFRQIGKTIATASEHKITIVATKPTAAWVGEGEEISFSNENFGQISLSAYKLAVSLKVSNELLQDSFYNLEDHFIKEFSAEFARAEENAFLNGTGENSPKGILPMLAASATGALQTTGTEITADDLISLQFSIDRVYRKKAVWLMNDATLAHIRRLKDSTGNFIWQPSLTDEEPSKIFGQAVYTSAFMPAPAAGNVAVLYGDFADYFLIGERGQREFQPLRELYAMSGQTAFLMTERIDAVITNPAAFRGLKIRG